MKNACMEGYVTKSGMKDPARTSITLLYSGIDPSDHHAARVKCMQLLAIRFKRIPYPLPQQPTMLS